MNIRESAHIWPLREIGFIVQHKFTGCFRQLSPKHAVLFYMLQFGKKYCLKSK